MLFILTLLIKLYYIIRYRFLELQTSKVDAFLSVHRTVILAIKDLCKKVNQSLLLQYLHDTKMCDRLLEPEDDKKEVWHSDNTTPTITRNASFVRMRSVDGKLYKVIQAKINNILICTRIQF